MKKIFLLLCIFFSCKGFSQVVNLKGDTVKIWKTNGNAELVLKNSTRALTGGFLRNMGNGRTSFVAISSTNGWGLSGNDSTTYLNFLGTINNRPLEFRVNNILGGKINIDSSLTLFGYQAGYGNTANGLSAFGVNAGASNTGGNVSFLGAAAGYQNTGTLVTGIGYNAAYQNTHSNAIAIGQNSKVLRDSAASYGDTSTIMYHGFGTAYPTKFMDVRGAMRILDGTQANGYVLTSDANGNTRWASAPSSGVVNTGAANRLAYYPAAAAAVDDLPAITASRAVVSDTNGLPVASAATAIEIGYINGLTSNLQDQLNLLAPKANPVFTGVQKVSTTDTLSTKAYARSVSGGTDVTIYKQKVQLAKDSYDWNAVGDYNIVANTGTDNAGAFQSQVDNAQTDSINSILIPFGHNEKYRITTPILITQGNFQIMGNAPTSNQRSLRSVFSFPGPPLGPFITASTAISSLFDYGNNLSTKPTGALFVEGLALYQKDIGSAGISGQSAAGFKISMDNDGPHRGITFRNSSFNGFQSAILIQGATATKVIAGDVNIETSNFGGTTYAVYSPGRVNDFRFVGNVAEDGASINGWFDGAVVINDNQLESSTNTINVGSTVAGYGSAQVEISNNYFEGNDGDYLVRVSGKSYNSSLTVGTNYGYESVVATDIIRSEAQNKVVLNDGASLPTEWSGVTARRAILTVMSNYNPSEPSAAVENYGALLPGTSLKGQDFYIDSMLPFATTPAAVQAWLNPIEYVNHPVPAGAVVTNDMLTTVTLKTPFGTTTTGRTVTGYTGLTLPVTHTLTYSADDYIVFSALIQYVNNTDGQETFFELVNQSNSVVGDIIGAQTRASYGNGWFLFTAAIRAAISGTSIKIKMGSAHFQSGPTTGSFNIASTGVYKVPAGDIEIRNSVKRVLIRPWNSYVIGAGAGTVTSVTGTAPIASTGGTTPVISVDTTKAIGKIATFSDVALKANILSQTFTGTPTLPTGTIATTQSAGDSTTKLATTAFVDRANDLKLNKDNFDDSLLNYAFTFRNQSLAIGDSLVLFTGTNKAIVKRLQAGTNISIASTNDSLLTISATGGSGDMILASVQTVTGAKTFGTIGGSVGKLILAGSTSGSSILNAAAVAGSTTLTLPGVTGTLASLAGTETFTNKRWTARVGSTTSSATPTINTDNTDIYKLTAQAAAITSFTTNLSGTPLDGDILQVQILDNGTARAITWGASFAASTVTLPTTTVVSTTLSVVFQYSTTSSYGAGKWICVNSF